MKQFVIETLALEDVTVDDIDSDMPLFGEGLGLDSVDALEIGIALKRKFQITVDPKAEETRAHFRSIRDLAAFVSTERKGPND